MPSEVVLCPGRTPDSVLVIFEVITEALPPDKPQDNLIDLFIQLEDKRHHLDQPEVLAMVALLIVVC
jgi:hypothetical protein